MWRKTCTKQYFIAAPLILILCSVFLGGSVSEWHILTPLCENTLNRFEFEDTMVQWCPYRKLLWMSWKWPAGVETEEERLPSMPWSVGGVSPLGRAGQTARWCPSLPLYRQRSRQSSCCLSARVSRDCHSCIDSSTGVEAEMDPMSTGSSSRGSRWR